jgi:Carboxypeptidase regulatory-like domain/TonB dependent receptor
MRTWHGIREVLQRALPRNIGGEHSPARLRNLSVTVNRLCLFLVFASVIYGDSGTTITGTVTDPSHRPLPRAEVRLRNLATFVERSVTTNSEGVYEASGLPVGTYRMQIEAPGFRLHTVERLTTQVARILVQDIQLELGDMSQEVTVTSLAAPIDRATTSVGHVVDGRTVQDAPLNGRYFLDLAILVPGSMTASQNGFSTTPSRGLGALAINTAGNREETVNYLVNGITLNNLTYSAIEFQPSINTVEEFKMDNSTVSAQYGESSGAIVNVATRSGSSTFHAELFEFLRNNALDTRNFFNLTSHEPPPFKRNQFGAALGGPIVRSKTFFFFSYEGLRQLQDLSLNSLVLSDDDRESISDRVTDRLAAFIPRPNLIDSSGTPRFVGAAPGPVNNDQWGLDIGHILTERDRLHGYYAFNLSKIVDPNSLGNTIPGFGHHYSGSRQFFSLNEGHTFNANLFNEARLGLNRQLGSTRPNAQLDPDDFGILDGITQPIGLPQISIAGGALNFGGPSSLPTGRGDTTYVAGDTLSCACGRNSLKIGGEYRQFLNNNFRTTTGSFNFPSVAAFLADTANSFAVTLGNQSSSIAEGAIGFFVQDNYRWRPNLTIELGLRYDWNMTPTERYDRFIVFDPASASLKRLGGGEPIYQQNNKNFQPRLGFAWDPFHDGKTSLRSAYGIYVDQPMTSLVSGTAGNPPLATPLTFTGAVQFENAIYLAQAAGLAPVTTDRNFHNAYVQSWNFNVQRELSRSLTLMAGYFGSKGTHLILRRNINQPIDGARPFAIVSPSSAILPGTPLGNVTQAESTGNSTYNALWISAARTVARGLQFNTSYTWSKSIDYNSLSTQGIVVQNSYDLRGDRGLSSFDARHRVVVRGFYDLPFRGHWFLEGWQMGAIFQAQTGNPVNIVTSNSTVTGLANTLRPNVTGPVAILGTADRWFDTIVFKPVNGFGNLGRDVVIGPGFTNTDFSVIKSLAIAERLRIQFRGEVFDLLNHANLGQPGSVAGSPAFGRIVNTRFPTGESGSSRQVQFGVKLSF